MDPDDLYWAEREFERLDHSTPFGRDVSRARLWDTGPYREKDRPSQARERTAADPRNDACDRP